MNSFLLIDFGASYIKSIHYDKKSNSLSRPETRKSPLYETDVLQKNVIKNEILNLIDYYGKIDAVMMCSILGGHYVDDTYYSWKNKDTESHHNSCLLNDIFNNSDINGIKCYSSYGDTDCVVKSVNLEDSDLLVNLGTGSQVISNSKRISFIPSGRVLNVFNTFFNSLGLDMFDKFSQLELIDLEKSSLEFDLNIFSKAFRFNGGGVINNILENNFNVDNFIASLFKNYIEQYIEIINSYQGIKKIYLTGGISKKYKLISNYISHKTNIKTVVNSMEHEDTHIGLVNIINSEIL